MDKDFSNAFDLVLQYSPLLIPEPDPETGLFEGDIRFTPEQMKAMHASVVSVAHLKFK